MDLLIDGTTLGTGDSGIVENINPEPQSMDSDKHNKQWAKTVFLVSLWSESVLLNLANWFGWTNLCFVLWNLLESIKKCVIVQKLQSLHFVLFMSVFMNHWDI